MKKAFILAGALAASVPALGQAQSNTTVYGLLDVALEHSSQAANGGGNAGWALTDGVSRFGGSRVGLRGSEDLGGGLKAVFQIEHRFSVDTGNSPATTWSGPAYVGLSLATGEVTFGRQYSPMYRALQGADRSGYGFYNNWAQFQGPSILVNSVSFHAKPVSGLDVYGAASLGENLNTARGSATFGNVYGLGSTYAMGQVQFGLAHQSYRDGVDPQAPAGLRGPDRMTGASVAYNEGNVGVSLGYVRASGYAGGGDVSALLASSSIKLGVGEVVLNLARVSQFDADSVGQVGLAYSHALSRRTALYAALGTNDLSPLGVESTARQIALGVRHIF